MAVTREEIDATLADGKAHNGTRAARVGHLPTARLWPREHAAPRVTANDPAILLITDFSREQAWTVTEEQSIDGALREMECAETGALLVVRSDAVVGLITPHEIQGRRPFELLQPSHCASRAEITVGRVMTPWDRIPVLDWRSISVSRVRHLEQWARNTGATHALLVEPVDGIEYVRGLLSRARMEHSLGVSL